jgi:UDP-glucose 4-epimerase
VFGDDYDTPDGTAIRDYVHVTDLAAAHLEALKLLLNGHSGGTFNLGTGLGYSVREILAAIKKRPDERYPILSSRDGKAIQLTWSQTRLRHAES